MKLCNVCEAPCQNTTEVMRTDHRMHTILQKRYSKTIIIKTEDEE